MAHTHIYSLLLASRDPCSNTSRNRFLITRIFLSGGVRESPGWAGLLELEITGGIGGCSKEDL